MTNTHFGFQSVAEDEKAAKVAAVFDSVASRYDVMNDLMSAGMHRLWKKFTLQISGVRSGYRVLDLASGSGDLARGFAKKTGKEGLVVMTDINPAMLSRGRDRALDQGFLLPTLQCDAEQLPFPTGYFHCVSVAFGLRNMTHKERALEEMYRVLKPGGCALILEFSKIWEPLKPLYDLYSFQVIPKIGRWIAKDEESYQYLAESIRMHPDQKTLGALMNQARFENVEWFNLSAGVVALHRGYKE
ncbi:bifunctional demethylmenaquinone methyltransferase/2-methoxy-6-polyprenyl-1,4-benzoquinol methylase UbiE [Ferrovum myxofaciens]|jgi:demethylmenaquinone methyltransferase/2-methoxy-6-polyprenyl-1,4-benzoquinol methylase|uniref:Ubiquinone/menaquinone biosynthesis C-methyltransferase UbiE n=2 Tax=root TaxID=1 RepID=A0A859A7N8_9PROT|nr:bifunctional demethylmenaquinone methyltransferase/2-methoxy-6-polyprenyl-1,4-benzoquinol methylase UbiE [Ferrovum myxofaciens]KXW59380.1 ubiquinone/menaquinone biosynthesis C-methyltransferase UbiE [Ferrovum myxofaciens]MBU6994311.1 bifunctional demethylmenaquinone methyltransferase/2-methoxy-6-polyprenyl-1,4-benzoquinol methylase UbiE [Ferrovum myxofaciens]QKE38213.1 MAG: bifunctional demethylmenaquinone methyltransferase/2-methoxy-6-polyprenyl-1,4-benzoquinol methylase UbiE [Ferrovum myxof